MPLVTDAGFAPVPTQELKTAEDLENLSAPVAIELPNDANPEDLVKHFNHINMIVVPFPSFTDGRGFSIAKRLRDLGYRGVLRARGHVISDQYKFARRCGFDEIEIDDAMAARQPEDEWLAAANSQAPTYRDKLSERAGA